MPERITIFANTHVFNPIEGNRNQLAPLIDSNGIIGLEIVAASRSTRERFTNIATLPKLSPYYPVIGRTRLDTLLQSVSDYKTGLAIALTGSNARIVFPDIPPGSEEHRELIELDQDKERFFETVSINSLEDFAMALHIWASFGQREGKNMEKREKYSAKVLIEEIRNIRRGSEEQVGPGTLLILGASHQAGLKKEFQDYSDDVEVNTVTEKGTVITQYDQLSLLYRFGKEPSQEFIAQSLLNYLILLSLTKTRLPQNIDDIYRLRREANKITRGLTYEQIGKLMIENHAHQILSKLRPRR